MARIAELGAARERRKRIATWKVLLSAPAEYLTAWSGQSRQAARWREQRDLRVAGQSRQIAC